MAWSEECLSILARKMDWRISVFLHWLKTGREGSHVKTLYEIRDRIGLPLSEIEAISDAYKKMTNDGVRVVYPGHPDFPERLLYLPWPPVYLAVLGELPSMRSISVVGSREPMKDYSEWMKNEFVSFLRGNPFAVVSGGARGVDQLAHQAALQADVPTVVVLPSGLGIPYPAEWTEKKAAVLRGGGCLISEYFMPDQMRPHHFERRNRIIAAWSEKLLVVQGARRSGTMITARHATELNHTVMALPGSPLRPEVAGNNELLAQGATFIRDRYDLMTAFSLSKLVE